MDSINLEGLNKGNDLLQIIPNKKEARLNRKNYFIAYKLLKFMLKYLLDELYLNWSIRSIMKRGLKC